jgi:hypothetical protein
MMRLGWIGWDDLPQVIYGVKISRDLGDSGCDDSLVLDQRKIKCQYGIKSVSWVTCLVGRCIQGLDRILRARDYNVLCQKQEETMQDTR